MGSTGWTADPLNVTYPPGAVKPATFIYIGDAAGDPTGALTIAGLDSGMVFAFGNGYAYVFGIFQEVGFNDAHLFLAGVDPFGALGSQKFPLIETDWQPPTAGGGASLYNIGDGSQNITVDGSKVTLLSALSDALIYANPGLKVQLGNTSGFGGADHIVNVDGALTIKNNEIGRGVWASVADTSSSAAIGTTTAVVLTLPSTTYKKGRAYRIYVKGGVNASTAGALADVRTAKSLGGQPLGELYRVSCVVNGTVYSDHGIAEFTVGAADVTASLVLTLAASSGTITHFGSAGTPRFMTVEDIGPSTSVSANLPVLT